MSKYITCITKKKHILGFNRPKHKDRKTFIKSNQENKEKKSKVM